MIKELIMDFGGGTWEELGGGRGRVMGDVYVVLMYEVLKEII